MTAAMAMVTMSPHRTPWFAWLWCCCQTSRVALEVLLHHLSHQAAHRHRGLIRALTLWIIVPSQLGGMGFLHYNCTVEEQLNQLLLCKRHVPSLVLDPLVLGPQDTVATVERLMVSTGTSCLHAWRCVTLVRFISAGVDHGADRISAGLSCCGHVDGTRTLPPCDAVLTLMLTWATAGGQRQRRSLCDRHCSSWGQVHGNSDTA